jgi:hypothetical protein
LEVSALLFTLLYYPYSRRITKALQFLLSWSFWFVRLHPYVINPNRYALHVCKVAAELHGLFVHTTSDHK